MTTSRTEARWWSRDGEKLTCHLCPHECSIIEGKVGICRVRKNLGMTLFTLNYGKICVTAIDSIEKKPIFHYRPGSTLYSVGTVGCNLDCAGCQNFGLARGGIESTRCIDMPPKKLVSEALSNKADGIAWTFNEPIVWSEYIIDASVIARKKSLYSMMNTNGFIGKEAREDLLPNIDVMKIDIKGFNEDFYRNICGGSLQPVLETCIAAMKNGVHVELAYLMIPSLNDSDEEIGDFAKWVEDHMGVDVPIHLFRFSPAHRLNHLGQESIERMRAARKIAKNAGLKYVYFGGVVSDQEQNTMCQKCGKMLIKRKGEEPSEKIFVEKAQVSRFCPSFSDVVVYIKDNKCPACGEPIKIKLA